MFLVWCRATLQCGRMDIVTGLSALNEAINLTRSLREKLKSNAVKSEEIAGRIEKIYNHIVHSKDALVGARAEIQYLKDRLQAVNDQKQIESELEHDGRVYWRNHGTNGPYCPICWDHDKRLVTLTFIHEGNFAGCEGVYRGYVCIVHGQRFLIPSRG